MIIAENEIRTDLAKMRGDKGTGVFKLNALGGKTMRAPVRVPRICPKWNPVVHRARPLSQQLTTVPAMD
jgi:hypothetical protein